MRQATDRQMGVLFAAYLVSLFGAIGLIEVVHARQGLLGGVLSFVLSVLATALWIRWVNGKSR